VLEDLQRARFEVDRLATDGELPAAFIEFRFRESPDTDGGVRRPRRRGVCASFP